MFCDTKIKIMDKETTSAEDEEFLENESSTVSFFSRRAKFVPKVSSEELKAASELVNKIHGEKVNIVSVSEDVSDVSELQKAPQSKRMRTTRSQKAKAKKTEIEVDDDSNVTSTTPKVALSAAAKRRLRKLQTDRNLELKRIEDENRKILSAVNASDDNVEEVPEVSEDKFENLCVLTILYMSEISRLKCHEGEKFSSIFPKVADLFKLKVSEFLLCLKEKNIAVEDTPKSLNLTDTDILECIPYKDDKKTEEKLAYNGDKLKIYFQSSDTKEKIDMFIHKVELMQEVMERYSAVRNIPLNLLLFKFDGDEITGAETADDLDMESENCIDVTILPDPIKKPEKKKSIELIDIIDSDSYDSDIICE